MADDFFSKNLVFNYRGKWVLYPQVVYIKRLNKTSHGYDVGLLSYIDICSQFIQKCGFRAVKQLSVSRPTSRYYLLEDDPSIMTIQFTLSTQFSILQLFVVDEGETTVVIPNICDLNKHYLVVPVEVGTDCESNEEDEDQNEPTPSDYNSNELEVFRKEKYREINDKLNKFIKLEKGTCLKDLTKAKKIVTFYSIVTKVALKVEKSDSTRLRYFYDIGCPFEYVISEDRKRPRKLKP